MIRIGIIGVGFMGYTHFEGARKLRGAKVTAVATRNPKKLAVDRFCSLLRAQCQPDRPGPRRVAGG